MELKPFQSVDNKGYSFSQVWKIYDAQFKQIYDFLVSLGDKYIVETIPKGTDNVINLSHAYTSNQIFVYINEVIQWKDIDYQETTSTSITLLKPREYEDNIKVIFIKSNTLTDNLENYIKELQDKIQLITDTYNNAVKINNTFIELYNRLEQRKHYYTNDEVSNALVAMESASKSANASATSASQSATSAKNAETLANQYANSLKTIQTNVANATNSANASATSASQSATSAKNAENLAKDSANTLSNVIQQVSSYKTSASQSASNAKTSETNAKTSETNAKSYLDQTKVLSDKAMALDAKGYLLKSDIGSANSAAKLDSNSQVLATELTNYYTKSETDDKDTTLSNQIKQVSNKFSNYKTSTETIDLINQMIANYFNNNYYTKAQTEKVIQELIDKNKS